MDSDEDLREAARLEQLGKYREAQSVLMPPGRVWTDRESYDRRMELFEQIQEKLYRLERTDEPAPVPLVAAEPEAEREPDRPSSSSGSLSVWDFAPGLVVSVVQAFTDYDGQKIAAGEVLHFLEDSYFFYEGGHTLRFAEKTIRLADIVDEHQPIIANAGNVWFRPLGPEG
jgi:hypothetical protein